MVYVNRGDKMNAIKNYIKNEDGLSEVTSTVLLVAISVVGVAAVGYMIYSAIASGQKAMGEDFTQGG